MKKAWLVWSHSWLEDGEEDETFDTPEFRTTEPDRYAGRKVVEIVYAELEQED